MPQFIAIEEQETFCFGSFELPAWEVFLKTELSYGCVNLKPVVPGHVLACPRRRVLRFSELTAEEIADLFLTVQTLGTVLQSIYSAPSLTLAVQDGKEAGQTVQHVHVHVIPRKGGDFPQNDDVYRELDKHDKEPDRPARPQDVMTAEALQLRAFFSPKDTPRS